MIDTKSLLADWESSRLTNTNKKEIKAEYKRIYPDRKINNGCNDCIGDMLREISYAYNKQNSFIIRRGFAIKYNGKCYHTNQMTDSQVNEYLLLNPSEKNKFEKIGE